MVHQDNYLCGMLVKLPPTFTVHEVCRMQHCLGQALQISLRKSLLQRPDLLGTHGCADHKDNSAFCNHPGERTTSYPCVHWVGLRSWFRSTSSFHISTCAQCIVFIGKKAGAIVDLRPGGFGCEPISPDDARAFRRSIAEGRRPPLKRVQTAFSSFVKHYGCSWARCAMCWMSDSCCPAQCQSCTGLCSCFDASDFCLRHNRCELSHAKGLLNVIGRHAGEVAFLQHRTLSDAQRKKLTETEQLARCMQQTLLNDAATATTTTSSFWVNIQVSMCFCDCATPVQQGVEIGTCSHDACARPANAKTASTSSFVLHLSDLLDLLCQMELDPQDRFDGGIPIWCVIGSS